MKTQMFKNCTTVKKFSVLLLFFSFVQLIYLPKEVRAEEQMSIQNDPVFLKVRDNLWINGLTNDGPQEFQILDYIKLPSVVIRNESRNAIINNTDRENIKKAR